MIMFKLFYNKDDNQPAYYLQCNPQNEMVSFDDYDIIEIAKKLSCSRIDKITDVKDFINWWLWKQTH